MTNLLRKEARTLIKIDGYFIFLWIVFAFTMAFILITQSGKYQSEITILVIAKNEKIAAASSEITGNLGEISHTLFFYEKMLKDNPSLIDEWSGLSEDKKKGKWNEKIKTTHLRESTTLSIQIEDQNKERANFLAKQSANTLFNLASKYYNVKTEIDLRITEGPVAKAVFLGWYWIVLISVVVGAFFSWLMQKLFLVLEGFFLAKPKMKLPSIQISQGENNRRRQTQKEKLEKLIENYAEKDNSFFSVQRKPLMRKSNPPENLPIASIFEKKVSAAEGSVAEKIDIIEKETVVPNESVSENIPGDTSEPTEEEFKRRLNQLLKGDL